MLAVAAPNAAFQAFAYWQFCVEGAALDRPWCHSPLPLAYPFVQQHYWNVGLFRYFTLQQVPNFLLAAPVLVLVALAVRAYWPRNSQQWSSPVAPHVLLAATLATLAFTAMHVQIATRVLCSSTPLLYWCAAQHPTPSLAFFLLYFALGAVLHPTFYPWT